jgi:hypothetical protein
MKGNTVLIKPLLLLTGSSPEVNNKMSLHQCVSFATAQSFIAKTNRFHTCTLPPFSLEHFVSDECSLLMNPGHFPKWPSRVRSYERVSDASHRSPQIRMVTPSSQVLYMSLDTRSAELDHSPSVDFGISDRHRVY